MTGLPPSCPGYFANERWRSTPYSPSAGQQALLVYLCKGETFADLAAGFEVGTATAWRYVNEVVALLAARASPDGDLLWVSGALPGSVHDKKAEWIWGVIAEPDRAGIVTLADKGYHGST